MTEDESGRVSLVVTESAGNVVRHGGGGEMLLQPLSGPQPGLEIVALDKGPGIADLAKALTDGHSTGGTPGTGLGAMRRLSSRFDLYSRPGQGTAVLMQVTTRPPKDAEEAVTWGGLSVPKPGEEECGDAWQAAAEGDATFRIAVADGLGHGPLAREAALAALTAGNGGDPGRALEDAHAAARATRGAAMAVAETSLASGAIRYAGLGNIAGVLLEGEATRSLLSMNGIVGQGVPKVRPFDYAFAPSALLIMASDGLATRWSPDRYPGLFTRHPTLVAAVLYRDHGRGSDDTTVVVARLGRSA
jgi:anti-sigma regulatory factor (Ser/Thr protein kinase)